MTMSEPYIPDELPLSVRLAQDSARRASQRDSEERSRLAERDRKARERAEAAEAADAEARSEAILAARRKEAQQELEAQLEKLHQEYLDAGGDPKGWKAFREQRAMDLIAKKISNREQAAQASFLSYARGQ
jgi:hypothetical protein